jgi:hypothetical protein
MRYEEWQGRVLECWIEFAISDVGCRLSVGAVEVQGRVRGEYRVFHDGEGFAGIVRLFVLECFISAEILFQG